MENEAPVLVLAGGKSSRLGQPKGLVPVEGRPWIEVQLALLAQAGLREAIVVLGYQHELYESALSWLGQALEGGAKVGALPIRAILNPFPEFGPFSSIQAGARHVLQDTRAPGAWVLPVDVPCPAAETWRRLSASSAMASIPTYQGRGGHPVRLSRAFLAQLAEMPHDAPDSRLDRQIQALGPKATRLEVDDAGVLKNLNLPSDWA